MKRIAGFIAGVAALLIAASAAAQADYPARTIHLIAGFPPGSQPDIVARLLGQQLAQALQQPVVVDNVTGAAGNIAAERIAKAASDGYTIGLLSQTQIVINPLLHKLPYDPLKDLVAVSQVSVSPNILVVNNAVRAASVADLVTLAKAGPGELTFASSGSGSGTHMAAELFNSTAGVKIRHIPYKGVVAAVPDLVAGRVTLMFAPYPVVLPMVRDGKLRAIAVTSARRSAAVPELPTVAESGYPGFEATNWYGVVVPAGTSEAIVRKLHLEIARALALPELRRKFAELGIEPIGSSPREFAGAIRTETPKWARLIEQAGIKAD